MSDDNPLDESPKPPSASIEAESGQQNNEGVNDVVVQGNADDAAAVIALAKQDFLVSFLVDARGGSMIGCRFSGVKVSQNKIANFAFDALYVPFLRFVFLALMQKSF